jgi:hypothetical protein
MKKMETTGSEHGEGGVGMSKKNPRFKGPKEQARKKGKKQKEKQSGG